jgi:hypothetical protein
LSLLDPRCDSVRYVKSLKFKPFFGFTHYSQGRRPNQKEARTAFELPQLAGGIVGGESGDSEAATAIHVQHLVNKRDQLVAEIEALRNKIAGLEIAIKLISEGSEQVASPIAGKVRVSETILSLLRESGETGLKPKAAIELAAGRGISLNRGSVYSLLNRMERAGTVVREDARYKLRVCAPS